MDCLRAGAPGLRERILASLIYHPPTPMSAEQSLSTITSGHQGPAGSASEPAKPAPSLLLCPSPSLNHCPGLPGPLLSLCWYCFFIFSPTYSFVFVLPSYTSSCPSPHPAVEQPLVCPAAVFRRQKKCIPPSFVSPPASAHTFPVLSIVSVPPAAPDHLALLPCLVSFAFVLPSLVIPFDSCQNITSSPGGDNTRTYLLFKSLPFFPSLPRRLSPAVCMCCIFPV